MTTIAAPETISVQATNQHRKSKNPDKATAPTKDLRYYLSLDYPVELVRDEETYVASHPDLPGCISMGTTPNEAVDSLAGVRTLWLEGQLASESSIPEPSKPDRYSGKFVLRVPKLLHRMAEHRARLEGISLNTYITSVLAGALGYPSHEGKQRAPEWGRPKLSEHEDWHRANLEWDRVIGVSGSQKTHSRESDIQLFWFASSIADQIGNHNKSTLKLGQYEDYHRAKEESHLTAK